MVKEDFIVDNQIMLVSESGEEYWVDYVPTYDKFGNEIAPWIPEIDYGGNDPIDMSLATIRQLPPNGVISMGDIRKEVSGEWELGACNLNQQEFRDLIAPRNSGEQQAMSEYYGKSLAPPAGDGEIGTGGNCFGSPDAVTANETGRRQWGTNKAYSVDGYCGWENKIQSGTGWYWSWAKWNLPWYSLRNRVDQVRISFRAMCGAQPSSSNYQADGHCLLTCGGNPYHFISGLGEAGASSSNTGAHNGHLVHGAFSGEIYFVRGMGSNGKPTSFIHDSYGCRPEESFLNLAGTNQDPSKLPNNGNDPAQMGYEHGVYWGNYSGGIVKTLYIRMENA